MVLEKALWGLKATHSIPGSVRRAQAWAEADSVSQEELGELAKRPQSLKIASLLTGFSVRDPFDVCVCACALCLQYMRTHDQTSSYKLCGGCLSACLHVDVIGVFVCTCTCAFVRVCVCVCVVLCLFSIGL